MSRLLKYAIESIRPVRSRASGNPALGPRLPAHVVQGNLVISSPLQEAIKRLGFAEEDFRHESSSGLAVSRSSNMIGADHRNSIIPFPLFHGTSSVFLPSVRTHGLGGKNIVEMPTDHA